MQDRKLTVLVTGACGFIGLNLCRHLVERGHHVVAADRRTRPNELQCAAFHQIDLNDLKATEAMLASDSPDWLLHLAARTDLGGIDLDAYVDNIVPTWNLLFGVQRTSPVTRVVAFSSMLEDTTRSSPAYFYGLSKRRGEEICAGFSNSLKVTVVRPPSVWGPHFHEPYRPFFHTVLAGRFVHCSVFDGRKTFAYVGNLVLQIEAIMANQDTLPHAFYLGDAPPMSANEFAREIAAQGGVRIRTVPAAAIWLAALVGSALAMTGIRFPITMFRLSNMRKGRTVDVAPINHVTPHRADLPTAVRQTMAWLGEKT